MNPKTNRQIKSAEIIDTPDAIDRFLFELKAQLESSPASDTTVSQTADGRMFLNKQNTKMTVPDVVGMPSFEQIKQWVDARNIPWDDQYAERVIPWWASDERVDRQGDIVLQNWNFEQFQENPLVLYAHKWDDPPIGTVINWEVVQRIERRAGGYAGRSLKLMPMFATKEQYAWADTIYRLSKARFLKTGSVGFFSESIIQVRDPNERLRMGLGANGVIYDKNNLVEWTIAPVPANQGALQSLALVARKGMLHEGDLPVITSILKSSVVSGSGDSGQYKQIDKAIQSQWKKLFPKSVVMVSTVDTIKQLPESYQEASGSQNCSNCTHYVPNDKDGSGYCKLWKDQVSADMVCLKWMASMPTEITKSEEPAKEVGFGESDMAYRNHLENAGSDPRKSVSLSVIKQVYLRGVNSWFNASLHLEGEPRSKEEMKDWGTWRVASFLRSLDNVRQSGTDYDPDLMPRMHPRSKMAFETQTVLNSISRKTNRFIDGDYVSWKTSSGVETGFVRSVETVGIAKCGEKEMEATPEDPVAVITVKNTGEMQERNCVMPFSRLRSMANPNSDSQELTASELERNYVLEMVTAHNREYKNEKNYAGGLNTLQIYNRGLLAYSEDKEAIIASATPQQYARARTKLYLSSLREDVREGQDSGEIRIDDEMLPNPNRYSKKTQIEEAIVASGKFYGSVSFDPPIEAKETSLQFVDMAKQMSVGLDDQTNYFVGRIFSGKGLSSNEASSLYSHMKAISAREKGVGYYENEDGYPNKDRLDYGACGGDAAFEWSKKVSRLVSRTNNQVYEPVGVAGNLRGRSSDASDRHQEIYKWVKSANGNDIKSALYGAGINTTVNYDEMGENDSAAKFISSVLLAVEIGGSPTSVEKTVEFVRGCVARAIQTRAMQQITSAASIRDQERRCLENALSLATPNDENY